MQKSASTRMTAVRLTESAIMLAFATVLSLVKIVDLPYGGSITACSMLPILIIAYRYGTGWGLFTAAAYSLLQLATGMSSVSYGIGISPAAAAAIILLDYIIAFMVLGLGGIFRKLFRSQGGALAAGALLACLLRYICHVISGCTVWAGLSIPSQDALLYSLAYNATYMVPETIITLVGAVYISRVLDFQGESITRTQPQAKRPDMAVFLSGLAKAALVFAAVWDVAKIFPALQDPESGDFYIQGIADVEWLSVVLVTVLCAALAVLLFFLCRRVPAEDTRSLKGLFSAIPFLGVGAAAVLDGVFIHNTLNKIVDKTAEALEELSGDGLQTAAKAVADIAANYWLQIIVFSAAVVAALILVSVRYFRRKNAQ